MSKLGFTKRDNYTRCKNSAIYSLAMREHSRYELYQKLQKKDYVEGVNIDKLLDELEQSDYLCEVRFTESFIRCRVSRGQGSLKISSELKNRGIERPMICRALETADVDWCKSGKEQLEKKFGKSKAIDFREKSKRMRFLSTRGFSHDVITQVVN